MNLPATNLAISSMNTHKIPISFVRFHLINNFHIPEPIQQYLKEYYLLVWESQYTLNKIKNGCINGYQIVYHKCTPTELRSCPQIRLSFRESIADYGFEQYVLLAKKGS